MANTNDRTAGALDTLVAIAEGVERADDVLDMLGALYLVEKAAEQARRAVIAQARAEGHTWHEIGDVLAVTRQAAQQRYGE